MYCYKHKTKPADELYPFKTHITNGNPLIPKRIAKALEIPVEHLNVDNNNPYFKNNSFMIRYSHDFEDYQIDIYFKTFNPDEIRNVVLKLMDAMALEPEYPNIIVTDINNLDDDLRVPYDNTPET